jgi:flagellar biosynthetic protein FliO
MATQTIPAFAWGADPQQQWAVGDPQGLIFTGLKMIGALALILGLMLLSLHFLKRWRSGIIRRSPDSQVQILDVRMLAPKKSVALVEVAGTRLLLGVGTETVTMLSRIDSPPHQVSEKPEKSVPGFAKTLAHTLRRPVQDDSEVVDPSANPLESRGHGETGKNQLTMLK